MEYSYERFVHIRFLLVKFSWDEIIKQRMVSRSSAYMYRNLFNVMFEGVNFRNSAVNVRTVSESLRDYHNFYMSVHSTFKFPIYQF